MKIRRVLVANRGEIACRILRTLRALGISGVAVHSEADRDAPHVALADAAAEIGPPAAAKSYLDGAKVIEAARRLDCDALHPGYGFLSENAGFAEACAAAGIVFIGPPVAALRSMGDKAEARRIAISAGVPPVPGYEGADDPARLAAEAAKIGFPLLVKARMGGGGKGMRLVRGAPELDAALESARREAVAAFGDGSVILERYVRPARHVEVQVLGDRHGQVIAFPERECSLQRRHQKVIEESPSPAVTPELRERLAGAAVRLGKAVGYQSAGTVEFLLGEDGRFHFLEMNTRLQVEHGVTELVTGEDLVAWQVRIAEGVRITLPGPVAPRGWAIEARICAEDAERGFLPQSGRIRALAWPAGPGVRVDAGIREGQEITPWYDPMLAKVLAHGSTREEARGRLAAALRETRFLGPPANIAWLAGLLDSGDFRDGRTFTHLLEERAAPPPSGAVPEEVLCLAAWALERAAPAAADGRAGAARPGGDSWSPFGTLGAFRLAEDRSS